MTAFTWFIFALSWKIIIAQDCDVTVDESCYFARIDGSNGLFYDEAVAYCQSQNAEIATIKSEDIYTQIAEKLRTKIEDGESFARVWIGTKLDSSGNLSPDGSYAKWFPDFPVASRDGTFDYLNVYLAINEDPNYIDQGMVNSDADRKIPGVICKKADPCQSVYRISQSNWIETAGGALPGMTQSEAQKLCEDKGGIMAYPTSKEQFQCYGRLKRSSSYMETWIGIFRADGSPNYEQTDGPALPYVEEWMKSYTNGPGERGVFTRFDGNNPPHMVISDRTSKAHGVICSRLD